MTHNYDNRLRTLASTMREHVWNSTLDAREHNYRQTLNAQQLNDYRVHVGELAEECPKCHATYVELSSDEFPDMIGTTYVETFTCCGHTTSFNDALEYDAFGNVIDVR